MDGISSHLLRLRKHLPMSSKQVGTLLMVERWSDDLPDLRVYGSMEDEDKVSVVIAPAEKSGWLESGSLCVWASSPEALHQHLTHPPDGQHLVDWNKPLVLSAVAKSLLPTLALDAGRQMGDGCTFHPNTSTRMYYLDSTHHHHLLDTSDLPAHTTLKPLSTDDIDKTVAKSWKFFAPHLREGLIWSVTRGLTAGLWERGELVAWVLGTQFFSQGSLFVRERVRGRGYAKLVVSALAKQCLDLVGFAYAFVEVDNTPSHSLYQKLGFQPVRDEVFSWVLYVPPGYEATSEVTQSTDIMRFNRKKQ